MSHQIESIAWVQERPWHGLGTEVPADISTEDMLVMAGLDWSVSQRPLYYPKEADSKIMKRAHGKYALLRDSDNKLFDITGERWNPVQNRDVIDFFREFVTQGDMTLETAGALKGGKFIWALARLGEDFKIGKDDQFANYLLLMSPHQVGYALIAQYTPVRVVCANTLSLALGGSFLFKPGKDFSGFRMTHVRKFDDDAKADAKAALGLAHEQITEFQELVDTLAKTRITDEEVSNFFYEVIQEEQEVDEETGEVENRPRLIKRFEEALLTAPGQDLDTCKGTLFGACNAVTFVVDHELGRGDDSRLTSAWTGTGQRLKQRAYTLAANMIS